MSLVKSTAIIGSLTLVSRLFGFVRDMIMANIMGASWLSDAFFIAFRLPNFFRRLLAEGAFSAAFVPLFAGIHTKDGKPAAMQFASEAMAVLVLILLLLNAVFMIFMPWILHWFAPGFANDPQKFDLSVTLSRIAFPYIFFISLVSLLGGILNSLHKFFAFAAAPILLNACLVLSLVVLTPVTPTAAHAMSIGVFVAGVAQLIFMVWFCKRADALPGVLLPRMTPHVRQLLKLIGPAALGAGVAQVNLLVDVILASNFEDGVSYLYYADRINELPIGVIGVAVGTALLPMLSRQIRENQLKEAQNSLNRAIELVLLFGVPACAALLAIPYSITHALYEHGAFTAEDTAATYTAMMAFAAGLPAFLLVKVFAPGFYANQDTKTPFIIASSCVLLNLVLNLILMQFYEHVGLAMSTSIAGWTNAIWMGVILHKRGIMKLDMDAKRRIACIIVAALAMVVILLALSALTTPWLDMGTLMKATAMLVLVGGGGAVYLALILAFRVYNVTELRGYLKR